MVIDLFSCRVVGWSVGDRLHRDLALAVVRKALVMRRPPEGLIHHSDRGRRYCSVEYQAELRRHGIRISMSGKGNRYDNPVLSLSEGPWSRRPSKPSNPSLSWRTVLYTRAEDGQAIARYIDGFHNPVRRHVALDHISPAQFEQTASR